ncbi:DUF2567 domain-containing protein [Streptomyces sp. NPDC020965]|uniref:DUF2567 domain-containing protein n=1 Tax=Streptomyces sp. NPDC020965 TaxID=3365105 RepID=UPI0037B10C60
MTAPLTPPPPPNDNPWQAPPTYEGPGGEDPDGPGPRQDLRDGIVVVAAVTLAGIALGLLWLWLAPRVPLISDGKAVFLKNSEGEAAVGADGTFALLALGLGALSAIGVFLFRRRGGIVLVFALALGGVLASLLAWGVGVWFGPTDDVVAHARAVGEGVTFDAPLKLNAKGALLAWPVAAMLVQLILTALLAPRDPEPELPPPPPQWGPAEQ